MITSIHQPNFFPWMGFFDKLNRSDKFVFLTSSIRSKNDKYLTRCSILGHEQSIYISIPLGIKQIPINQLLMPINNQWKTKTLNIIHNSYHNSFYYEEVVPDIRDLLLYESEYFSEYSINVINFIVNKLNIDTQIFIDTDFNKDFGSSNERNIEICKAMKAETYLSGIGARDYNDANLFKINNIDLIYQDYMQSQYNQNSNKFIPGLSIIDLIFNYGYDSTEKILKANEI
ncbi:WbqC family protein [Candidatus Pseudothioglobus singularis]|jgi:hypothetical protein|nr:WbqC family protein [Candidatus Pseudothioglobus singularis]